MLRHDAFIPRNIIELSYSGRKTYMSSEHVYPVVQQMFASRTTLSRSVGMTFSLLLILYPFKVSANNSHRFL